MISLIINKDNWVVTARNSPHEDYVTKFKFGYYVAKIHLHILSKCKYIVSCSPFIKNSLKKYTIDSLVINNSGPKNQPIKSKKAIEDIEELSWVIVGTLNNRKNNKFLLDIFSTEENLGQLHLIGTGDQEEELTKSYAAYPNIHFHGHMDNPHLNFKNYNILLSGSKSEGLPNSVLEALSMGMPCALSNIPPHSFLKKYHHDSIMLFDIESKKEDTIKFFKEIIDSFYQKTVINNLYLHNEFGIEKMTKSYAELYKKILK